MGADQLSGRERTLAVFKTLFAEAGFELEQTVVTRPPFTGELEWARFGLRSHRGRTAAILP